MSRSATLIASVAGLVAGATSMAVGECASVTSQRDAEHADIEVERREIVAQPADELDELTRTYVFGQAARTHVLEVILSA